jgi:hypothetical protein
MADPNDTTPQVAAPDAPRVPAFTQEDADCIYEELATLRVDLDADPLAFGPKRLNGKVSEVRMMLSRCERLYLSISQKLHAVRRGRRRAEADLDLSKKHLYANDPETRAGRSVGDREAIATGKLLEKVHLAHDLETSETDLGAVLVVIKAKRTDLKDTEGRLRDQTRLCGEEIGLGARWGSKVPHSTVDLSHTPANDIRPAIDAVDRVEGEFSLPQLPDTPPAPAEPEEPAPAEPEEPVFKPSLGRFPTDEEEALLGAEVSSHPLPLDEPEPPPEPPKALEQALPATTAHDDVDAFFDAGGVQPSQTPPKSKDVSGAFDGNLDSLLEGFEKP